MKVAPGDIVGVRQILAGREKELSEFELSRLIALDLVEVSVDERLKITDKGQRMIAEWPQQSGGPTDQPRSQGHT